MFKEKANQVIEFETKKYLHGKKNDLLFKEFVREKIYKFSNKVNC